MRRKEITFLLRQMANFIKGNAWTPIIFGVSSLRATFSICQYMPVPSHIIKRVDYGGWCISSSPTDQKKGSIVQTLAKRLALPEQEFIARFCSPPQDPNARILYINTWRQKNA